MSYYDFSTRFASAMRARTNKKGTDEMVAGTRGRQRLAQQVIDQLRMQIETGKLREGDQLPTEPQLEATFGVSRTVVREAIADLRAAGFVQPVQGKGVFVSDPKAHGRLLLTPVEVKSIPETLELLEFRMAVEG